MSRRTGGLRPSHRPDREGLAVGDAFTLATPENNSDVRAIERFIGQEIPRLKLEGFAYKSASDFPPRPAQQARKGGGGQRGGGGGGYSNRPSVPHPRGKPGAHWGRR